MSEPLTRIEIANIQETMRDTFFNPLGGVHFLERIAGQKGGALFPKFKEIVEQYDTWEEVETELNTFADETVEAVHRDAASEKDAEYVREFLDTMIYNARETYSRARELPIESYESYMEMRQGTQLPVDGVSIDDEIGVGDAINENVIHVDFGRQARM